MVRMMVRRKDCLMVTETTTATYWESSREMSRVNCLVN
jgi:hypothetical protein